MKKSTKADMGIRRRVFKLLRIGPQRRDRSVEALEYGIVDHLDRDQSRSAA
jgi:hypothetical protein